MKEIYHKSISNMSLLGKSVEMAYMTDLLQAIIDAGYPVNAIPVYGGWVEVDTVSDLYSKITRERIKSIDGGL